MASKKAITKALLRLTAIFPQGQKADLEMERIRVLEYSRVLKHCLDQDVETAVDMVIDTYMPGENGLPWFPVPAVLAGYVQSAARMRINRGDPSLVLLPDNRDQVTPERFDRAINDSPGWLRAKMQKLKAEMGWK